MIMRIEMPTSRIYDVLDNTKRIGVSSMARGMRLVDDTLSLTEFEFWHPDTERLLELAEALGWPRGTAEGFLC